MTEREKALSGIITDRMKQAAGIEKVEPEFIKKGIAEGSIAVTGNELRRGVPPMACGSGLAVKVNANLGTSPRMADIKQEQKKLEAAVAAGADSVMDLSVGGDIRAVRRMIISKSPVAVGTVPVYQAAADIMKTGRPVTEMKDDDFFLAVEEHVEDGVDFITVHCGVTQRSLSRLKEKPRVMGIVSRGGSLIQEWMEATGRENPYYEQFDRLLEIARLRDVVLSLGDGLRPGCQADATDAAQVEELSILGDLTLRSWAAGVQVMIEGPGHIPLNQVEINVRLQKSLCHGAPFYVLGPLVTDIAPGYDHISSAIGGAVAAMAGADFLCYVTPAEHLRLPVPEDVFEGVMASRLAAHAADIARGIPGALERDLAMSRCRRKLDWSGQMKHALDPGLIRNLHSRGVIEEGEGCTMCGDFCPFRDKIHLDNPTPGKRESRTKKS